MDKKFKIVSDSSGDIHSLGDFPFASAPLKIIAGEREWIDDAQLDIEEMVHYLLGYSGKSGSACPSPADWTDAFEDYENIFCITISSNLSGSYNAATIACEEYMAEHPGRKAHVFDSFSTGPEMRLSNRRGRGRRSRTCRCSRAGSEPFLQCQAVHHLSIHARRQLF